MVQVVHILSVSMLSRGVSEKMQQFWKQRWFAVLVYALLSLFVIYMLLQVSPVFSGLYKFLKAVLAPFIIAVIISYILNPVVNLLNGRKVPRAVAVLMIYLVFFTSLWVVIMNVTPVFVKQLGELNEHMPQLTMRAESLMQGLSDHPLLPPSVRAGIQDALFKLQHIISERITKSVESIGSTINMLFIAFIIPFLAFYMLKDFQLMEKAVLAIVPRSHRKHIIKVLVDIDTALGNYIRGQLLVCFIIGILAYIGYWVIGMPYALLLATVVAIFNIIPYLGPFFGAAPALVVAATVSFKMVLLVAVINLIVQILEGNFISPQVVGRTLHMHPLLIIFALLVGGEAAGIVGLILAVPVFAVFKVILQHLSLYYINRKTV
ncbi:putative membrane protein [Paenibacillus larvae subsp. larvae]|nr:putative membrane protein [Paenibacillus larvae subsp. larvae]AVG13111.1 putative membrane protein [Paenibacillus larvae subsp. larvae DSM 25430]ETK30171.1 putative membrane protein [Paenibacillus larvae subsp. larvae DSM 25719]AVF27454.1 putative membrane protein [Paenibacillus larvae subsp. larvae]AVF32117.1 putative membrane protein [Paenibacillus larvae subsp. larvae]